MSSVNEIKLFFVNQPIIFMLLVSFSGATDLEIDEIQKHKDSCKMNDRFQSMAPRNNEINMEMTNHYENGTLEPNLITSASSTDDDIRLHSNEVNSSHQYEKRNNISNNSFHDKNEILSTILSKMDLENRRNASNEVKKNDVDLIVSKMLNISDLKRTFSPSFNMFMSRVLSNMSSENNLLGTVEPRKDLGRNMNKPEIKNRSSDVDSQYNYIHDRLFNELDEKLGKKLKCSNNSLHKDNENLIDRLIIIKKFVDSIEHDNHDNSVNLVSTARPRESYMNNENTKCKSNRSGKYVDEISVYQDRLKELFGRLMKEILLKDHNYYISKEDSDSGKLSINNTDDQFHNAQTRGDMIFQNYLHDEGLNLTSQTEVPGILQQYPNSVDKYISHNLVQLSDNRADKEYPIEVFQRFGRILPFVNL